VDEDRKEELRRQFGTVWKMASTGLDTLREVVVRSSQSGRLRVDLALLQREKQQLLEALGAQVAQLLEAGKLEVPSAVRTTYERLRDLEERLRVDGVKVHDNAFGATRGYEAEASPYVDEPDGGVEADPDDTETDEHAQIATSSPRRRKKR
jgi:hypothetical protein